MKTDNIPTMSYLFIGVISLVLTYATIDDKRNEFILTPSGEEQTSNTIDSLSMPEINVPSFTETVSTLKTLNPFSTQQPDVIPATNTTSNQETIPVAVPVVTSTESQPPLTTAQTSGGNRSKKNKNRKQKKTRRTRS